MYKACFVRQSSHTKTQLLNVVPVLYRFLSFLFFCLAILQYSDFSISNQAVPGLKLYFFPQMPFQNVSISSPVGIFLISIFRPVHL